MNPKKLFSIRYTLYAIRSLNGQAALEFAIFFPLFALVIAMIIQFSWLLFTEQRTEMAAFRGTLYAARNIGADESDVKEEIKVFFPEQQQDTIEIRRNDFKQKPAASNTIDYAELTVRADVKLISGPLFGAMWDRIAQASKIKAGRIADMARNALTAPNSDDLETIDTIRNCYDEYSRSRGIYTVCVFHKVAYDPDVPFSKQ